MKQYKKVNKKLTCFNFIVYIDDEMIYSTFKKKFVCSFMKSLKENWINFQFKKCKDILN